MALGQGVGLRTTHFRQFLEGTPPVAWVEAISENFMGVGGRPLAVLEKVRRDRPVVLHGVSLGVGSAAPLELGYLDQLKALIQRIQPALVSDHLCWGRAHGRYVHDLLPMPLTEEALDHVVARVTEVQDRLDRRMLLENVSSYMSFKESELTEWEFLTEVSRRADCGILLDVNNIYVSARNHGFDPRAFLDGVPVDRVQQFHLAGHEDRGTLVLDTHEGHIVDAVWDLYRHAVRRFGAVPTLIEWDEAIPELPVLLDESAKAGALMAEELPRQAPVPEVPRLERGARPPRPPSLKQTQDTIFLWVTGEQEPAQAEALVNGGALEPADRVQVYGEMYWLRMRDMLRLDYPRVLALLGEASFDVLTARYMKRFPSTRPSLNDFGRNLAALLEEQPVEGAPWLRDLARVERARTEAFVAADSTVLEAAALQALGEGFGQARLVATPAVRLVHLEHDVLPCFHEDEARPEKRPLHVVAWRKGYQAFHVAVPADEAQALERVLQGATLAEVCEAFGEREEPARAAFEAIGSWVNEGMIARVEA
jgi:uncharacterized protein